MKNFRKQSGMSIIELMIAMTIGLLIMAGLANLFVQTKQSFRQDNIISRMQEDARFAMNLISTDVAMAGFFGPIQESISIENAGTIAGSTAQQFVYGIPMLTLDNDDGSSTLDWGGTLPGYKAGTDAISIRRVEGSFTEDPSEMETGHFYLETNGQEGNMIAAADGSTGMVNAEFWKYTPSIYYIRSWCRTGDGIPSLVKVWWDGTGVQRDCIAAGIEDMQVELGLDHDEDLVPEEYVSQTLTTADTAALAAVRIHLLGRATRADQEYTNSRTYNIGNAAAYTPGDRFYRRVYTTTVQTRNPTGYRALTYAGTAASTSTGN